MSTPVESTASAPPDVAQRSFRQSLMAILGICFVTMMVALDQTVVGTAMPIVVAELKGFALYAWVATSYLLASVITVPIFGRLGDHYGRKWFVVASIFVFTLASVLCGMANSMLALVLARALQGIGGGMMIGTAFACIPDLFPDTHVRLRWQVLMSSAFGIANAIGPSLGGFLTEHFGWRSVFYVNLPVGLLSLWFVWHYMPFIRHGDPNRPMKLDWPGALLIALGLGGLQLLVEMLPKQGFDGWMISLAIVCTAGGVGLWWWEHRSADPILPPALFRLKGIAAMLELSMLSGFAMFSLMFYVPLMLQGGFGLSPQQAGVLITPLVLFITVGSILNGRVISRMDRPTLVLYGGFILMALACIGIVNTSSSTPHVLIVLYMLMCGTGLGFVMPNLTIFTQEMAGRAHLGIATAVVQSMRMVGSMLGTALVGTLVSHQYTKQVEQTLGTGGAARWLHWLADPQLLVSQSDQQHFLMLTRQVGVNGANLIDNARAALVSAVHHGQVLALAMVLFALWRLRRVPKVSLRRDAQAQVQTGE